MAVDLRPIDVERDHIESLIEEKQSEGAADSTINMYLRGWRAFFNWLHNEGFIVDNPMANVKLIKAEKRVIQTFSKAQVKRLLDTPNRTTFTGYRDYVLMLLLLDTGVRITEAEGIRTTDIDWANHTIKVFGKGRKERFVPFQGTLEKHLREYISIRGVLPHDFLFVNIDDGPLKKRTMQQEIAKYGAAAGIKDVRVSPHTFRHTFAKFYVMNGGDPFSLQKILGHTSLEIVRVYVNLFGTDIAKQHRKFSPLEHLEDGD
jgi:integrase/recombinase XerD